MARNAGKKLDEEVAQRVLGLVPCRHWRNANLGSSGVPVTMRTDGCTHNDNCYPDPSLNMSFVVRPYSTDIKAAWEVVKKMLGKQTHRGFGCAFDLAIDDPYGARCWSATFTRAFPDKPRTYRATDVPEGDDNDTRGAPIAICRAALRVADAVAK